MSRCGRVVLCCLLLSASIAQAATVDNAVGPVSVNSGKGFRSIQGAATVRPGDTVMAGAGGEAEIVYDNGCRQKVPSGETVTIPATPPCEPGANFDGGMAVLGALAIGGVVGGIILLSSDDDNPSSP